MSLHLYDNSTGTWDQATIGVNQSVGVTWKATSQVKVTALRWLRASTGTSRAPGYVRVWDTTTSAIVLTASSVTDNGAVGWQDCPLPADWYPIVGRVYVVAGDWSSGSTRANTPNPGSPGTPPAPLEWAPGNVGRSGGYGSYPDTSWNLYFGVDVVAEESGPPPPGYTDPATYGTTSDELARWESTSAILNTHQTDGLPWQTKLAVAAAQTEITTLISTLGNVTAGDVTTYGLSGRNIGAAISAGLAMLNQALDAATKLHNLLSTNGTGGDTYDYHGALEDTRQKVYDIEARQLAQLQPPPPASWVSQGTTTFASDLAWTQEADLYTITYSDTGSATVNALPSGVGVAYRIMWWAVYDGERMRDRRFADGVLPVLYDGGARMPGVVLHSTAGAAGTIEAWLLT